jgi:putative peptide zinc metalloprotease protein
MSGALLASTWYRVADLKPRLRPHARLHRHRYRGELWYLLQDPISNRVHRFTPAARLFIAAMDGQRTVQKLWEMAQTHLGEDAPTQDEVINLLGTSAVASRPSRKAAART